VNPCSEWSFHKNIVSPDKCNGTAPAPAPLPPKPLPPQNHTWTKDVVRYLLKAIHITDIDVDKCVDDVGGAEMYFRMFAADLKSKQIKTGVIDLSRGLSALSNSVSICGTTEVQTKIDALAKAIRWANISTAPFDRGVKIIVGASELWDDLAKVAAAVETKDPEAVGQSLNTLLDDFTTVTGGCKDRKACQIIDGLLRVIGVTASNVDACEAALEPAVSNFEDAAHAMDQKDYKDAVGDFATALDAVAKSAVDDSCGLKGIAAAIGDLSPRLSKAVISMENSSAVHIIVGSADVYDELYTAGLDLKNKDYVGVGMEMGALLAKLRASGCTTKACIIVEGLLGTMQVEFSDLKDCEADLDKEWTDMQKFVGDLKAKNWKDALPVLGDILGEVGQGVSKCGLPQVGTVLENTAKALHEDSVAHIIEESVAVLVSGADVTQDLQKIIVDSESENWADLGKDLGVLSNWISTDTQCNSFVCHLIEGILQEADIALTDLKPCEAKLRLVETEFIACAENFAHGQPLAGLQYCSAGLNSVAQSVDACGLATQLEYIEQEANVLGLGNLTILGDAAQIIVHGADFYEMLYSAIQDMQNHDYRDAGSKLAQVMDQLSKWTTGHLCSSPVCYIVNGVMQFLNDLDTDAQACKADFPQTWGNLTAAYNDITTGSTTKDGHFQWNKNVTLIKKGVNEVGLAFQDMSTIVAKCHLTELADILEKLAVKLGLSPDVVYIQEALKILIDGVQIEREISEACNDYDTNNWPAFGYNMVKIVKQLLTTEQLTLQKIAGPKDIFV